MITSLKQFQHSSSSMGFVLPPSNVRMDGRQAVSLLQHTLQASLLLYQEFCLPELTLMMTLKRLLGSVREAALPLTRLPVALLCPSLSSSLL